MSLTVGRGPFGNDPAGRFNVEIDPPGALLFWDPVPYRVRALLEQETVLDSRRVMLLHETGFLPVWHFPEDDLRADLVVPSTRTRTSESKGEARYRSIRVGDRVAPDSVWSYASPPEPASFLAGYVALDWHSFDEWFVEDEQAFGHPRDPYSRIDVFRTTRHVRWTRCAYKGSASYWHLDVGGRRHDDLVWSYPAPQHDAEPVRDLLAFFNERVDLEVDGELGERPRTQWSRD